jgi:hypothetical protein
VGMAAVWEAACMRKENRKPLRRKTVLWLPDSKELNCSQRRKQSPDIDPIKQVFL